MGSFHCIKTHKRFGVHWQPSTKGAGTGVRVIISALLLLTQDCFCTTNPNRRRSLPTSAAIPSAAPQTGEERFLRPAQAHMHRSSAHDRATGPTGNSRYFRWSPLLWNGQKLHMLLVFNRKGPASWKALLIHHQVLQAVIQQEETGCALHRGAHTQSFSRRVQNFKYLH